MKSVCQNKWCKATFELKEGEQSPVCPKCLSMSNDLSGGVTWEEKKYEGSRWDGLPHITQIKVNRDYK